MEYATRKIARSVARAKMRDMGLTKVNKPHYYVKAGLLLRAPSYFAQNWRGVLETLKSGFWKFGTSTSAGRALMPS